MLRHERAPHGSSRQSAGRRRRGFAGDDESNRTCNGRFAAAGIPQTEEARCVYRELIVTAPGLGKSISGTILYDEGTICQTKQDGTPFVTIFVDAGITPGIKGDIGAQDLAGHSGEKMTEGLDGLRKRLNDTLKWELASPNGTR